jgi:two-component system response regulator (stage 0 sporulation protein F)
MKRILVVDDEPDIRLILADCLESYGFLVGMAASGSEALRELEHTRYDGMLLDIRMPGLDGLEVLKQVRQAHPALPIIMVTGSVARASAVEALKAGAKAYILKPFEVSEVKRMVERWIGPPGETHDG